MNQSTYIIGEIGQNHNGSVEIAIQLIDAVAQPVVDNLFGGEAQTHGCHQANPARPERGAFGLCHDETL